MENSYQSYGASPATWDRTVLPATRRRWTRPVSNLARQLPDPERWKAELTLVLDIYVNGLSSNHPLDSDLIGSRTHDLLIVNLTFYFYATKSPNNKDQSIMAKGWIAVASHPTRRSYSPQEAAYDWGFASVCKLHILAHRFKVPNVDPLGVRGPVFYDLNITARVINFCMQSW